MKHPYSDHSEKTNDHETISRDEISIDALFDDIKIGLFIVILLFGCVLGFLVFLRPTESESENRKLTEFPAYRTEEFLNGTYTEQLSLWYSDTYPGREALCGAYQAISGLWGLRGVSFGSTVIPDQITDNPTVWDPNGTDIPPENIDQNATGEMIQGYYVKGNTAYQLYYFNKQNSDRYTSLVVRAAKKLDGIATVYDTVIPLSYCFGMPEELQLELNVSNGFDAIDYLYRNISSFNDQAELSVPVVTIDVVPTIQAHLNEYLFFRTDHHWTQTCAYHVSRQFLDLLGRPYPSLEEYTQYAFNGFCGSLYRYTSAQSLKDHPDTIYGYASPTVETVSITTREGDVFDAPLVDPDAENAFSMTQRYRCFVNGDYPYYEIHNDTITDGSSVLVIKESYGNAFIPMLADSFEYVYAMDYRFYTGSITEFVKEHDIKTVLFLNNLVATSDDYTVGCMERLVNRP